jgi:ParB family chromosome partitioning protein
MSIKDRLTKKTQGLIIPNSEEVSASAISAPLRTGPGQMMMVNSLMQESNKKVALLEQRLKEFEDILPVRLINAQMVVASKWANRSNSSFTSVDFLSLKNEILQAGGNIQPIKVRPLPGSVERYEIIFGYRRHRACLDLGLPVLALVEQISDKELFKEMDRENRERLDLSPWEQGRMYRQSLNEGLFASLGELSKEIGIDKGNLSKALRLADLPDVVVKAFPSPLDLQFRWAKLLNDALQVAPDQVLARAQKIINDKMIKRSAKEVLDILLGIRDKDVLEHSVEIAGKSVAQIRLEGDRVSVIFSKGVVREEKITQLHSLLKDFLHD